MVKGRQWKTKLKSYENSSFNKDNTPRASTSVESVSDKIKRLRIEQHRAENNRLKLNQPPEIQPNLVRYETNNTAHRPPVPLTAGPPPPPSWRSNTRERQVSVQRLQEKRKVLVTPDNANSLYTLCAHQAARQIIHVSKKSTWADVIPYLSVPVKQTLMQYISLIDGLDDILFDLFVSFDYNDLCFEGTRVSFATFYKAYWRVEELRQVEEADDWWDQEEFMEVGYEHRPIDAIGAEEADIKDEREIHLEPVISALLTEQHRIKVTEALLDRQGYFLFSPLSSRLTCLNISFAVQWPNISLAHLLVTTMPGLQQLRTAGCFHSTEGPRAISILSQGLRALTVWDIGFHHWLTVDIICGITGRINWKRDLGGLTTLYLQNLQEGVAAHVRDWLTSEGYRQIRVVE
ncbi:unnamed protein product [Rhizopus stolonifer]